MAFRLELSDLPPRYRAQAEAQLAKGRKKRSDPLAEAARAAKITGKEFDSLGEYEYYIGTVAPKVARGEIVEWEAHPCFPLFPAGQYGALKLRPVARRQVGQLQTERHHKMPSRRFSSCVACISAWCRASTRAHLSCASFSARLPPRKASS